MDRPDAIIIGSGPAGVSAAFPLLEAGLKVLMIDASQPDEVLEFPASRYELMHDPRWKISQPEKIASSPKFRIPNLHYVFRDFAGSNRIAADHFMAVGSLARGGLSMAWGAGVAVYDDHDFAAWPVNYAGMEDSYRRIITRIGVCGEADALPAGLRHALQQPVALDGNHRCLLENYRSAMRTDLSLWQAHNAVLTAPKDGREACNLSGLCLWGCGRGAIWNAGMELAALKRYPHFYYRPGLFVQKLAMHARGWECIVEGASLHAKKIFLAAGAIATTRIVLATLGVYNRPMPFQSTPSCAFMLWVPWRTRAQREDAFAMAQLGFSFGEMSGSSFSAAMLPVEEYIAASGLPAGVGKALFNRMLPSCVVVNGFLPGDYSDHRLMLGADGRLHIHGAFQPTTRARAMQLKQQLARAFRGLGAWMVPGSFTLGEIGSDVRYAGMLPMRHEPGDLQTTGDGQLHGNPGLYVIDAACFSSLAAKAPTLTIMANADRIARIAAA